MTFQESQPFSENGSFLESGGGYFSKRIISPKRGNFSSKNITQEISVYDENTEITTLQGHTSCVTTCDFSKDCKYIITGSRDKTIKIWDTNSWKLITTLIGHSETVNICKFIQMKNILYLVLMI